MKTSIYQIEKNYLSIIDELIENGGELTDGINESLMITKDQLQNKAVNYSFVIKQIDSDIEQIDAEIKRLNAMKKVQHNVIDRLKSTLTTAMNIFEVEEIKTALIKINFRNSESVEITNESQLLDKFLVTKTVTTPDKKAIKDAIKNGESVEGAIISYNKTIQIK